MNLTHPLTRAARTTLMLLFLSITTSVPLAQENEPEETPTLFLALVIGNTEARETALRQITETWRDEFIPMTLESVSLMRDSATAARMMTTSPTLRVSLATKTTLASLIFTGVS